MTLIRSRFALVLVAVAALAAGCGGSGSSGTSGSTATDQPASAGSREIAVAVTDRGFEPAQPEIKPGEAVTLVITRKTEQTCATDVMFPRLDKHVDLPLNQAVRVDIPAGTVQDTLYFACGMNMITGQVTAK
jgi:plastocyanin domain-containing protein